LHRPSSTEAISELLPCCADPKFVAGGMTLLPAIKLGLIAPSDVIDVTRLPGFRGIAADGKRIRIGAATTHAAIVDDKILMRLAPAFCELAKMIGDRHVRNRGTIGGALVNNDPAADYPAAVLATDAEICTASRRIAASEFFLGMFETALRDGELVTAIEFTAPEAAVYEKFAHPASGFALAGVFVTRSSGKYRVGVTGASTGGVFRFGAAEEALNAGAAPEAIDGLSLGDVELFDDRYGSRAYRQHLVRVLTRRAVKRLPASSSPGASNVP
jgi:aerobic carbon-monoxide dehydrogenase medium subunit